MYKAVVILYIVCFGCYLLLSRFPDYFESDFIKGTVQANSFSDAEKEKSLIISYKVGSELLHYQTNMWLWKDYNIGDKVTMIYNPSIPQMASVYSIFGYWIKWPELIFTAGFFILLFLIAKYITGNPETNHNTYPRWA